MSKLFFDHLVIKEEIDIELSRFNLTDEEKSELVEVVDQTLINHVLNVVLNHLPKDKHSDFVSRFHAAPHDLGLLEYLKVHAHPQIEEEIKKQVDKIKKEILSEVKKTTSKR
jgi:hypothetical protein